ncbi:MAG TPA: GH25 family lysozyme, partial [Planctomycetota bacterium]|nr:GH25 family lysozyme [Planctomycetota bacterium]
MRKSLVASLAFASAVLGGGVSTAGPSSSYCKGVDVSKYQGTINWAAAAAHGITFGIARVSDGTRNPDAYFQRNWAGMKANGIVRGVYQFFRPEQSAVAQADLLINAVSFEPGDMPPFLDVEVTDGVSWSGIHAGIAAWCNEIQAKTGLTPLIYTAPGLWSGSPPPGVGLWIANWGVSSPHLASGWNDWVFWQYTDNTYPSASDGDVFHGTLADLRAWCAANGPGGSPGTTTSTSTSTSTSGSSSTAGYPTLR